MNTMNMQGNTIKNNNKNKRKKLRTLVLSPNVNDYDTGEYLYPNNFHINDSQKDRLSQYKSFENNFHINDSQKDRLSQYKSFENRE
jgi:tRNA A22 N-methylase